MKIRGSASQIFEKYQALARDASSSGDYIAAENFYQHAEHYFRILTANAAANGAAPAVNGAAREAVADGEAGTPPQPAPGPNGGSRPAARGRRNAGSVRPYGEAAPPRDPGAGPQPDISLPEGDRPQHEQAAGEAAGS